MADPVSWLLIKEGWHVFAADGEAVGHVYEVLGDTGSDIFDGLTVTTERHRDPHYVPADDVGTITDGVVRLTVRSDELS